jgi:hypothetical protein
MTPPPVVKPAWTWQTIPQGTKWDDRMLAELNRRMKMLEQFLKQ